MGWAVEVVDVTGSTNADLVAAARGGERGPRVLAARAQTAGRGRLGRGWVSAPGSSLSVSVLLAPVVPQAAWTWLPALVGLAVLDTVRATGGPVGPGPGEAALKWPNDVVVRAAGDGAAGDGAGGAPVVGARTGLAKLAGILAEAVTGPAGPAVVLGVGVNLADPGPDLGAPAVATSLARLLGRPVALEDVLPVLVDALAARTGRWQDAGGAPAGLAEDYRRACSTLGRHVRASTPGGVLEGTAVAVDDDGALVLDGAAGRLRVSAGDVEHLR